ncbi:MAG: hypothetical protein QOJ12_2667 [Thermoleophilales bacterium]|nr:hypothetical protein [Thermoleophilales bacterium]
MTRKTVASLAVAAAALLAPQAASAADLYVAPTGSDTQCSVDAPCTLDVATDAANQAPDRDTIHVSGAISRTVSADLTQSPIDLVGAQDARIDFALRTSLNIGRDSSASGLDIHGAFRGVVIEPGGQLRDSTVEALRQEAYAVLVSGAGEPTRPAVINGVSASAPEGTAVRIQPTSDSQQVQIADSDLRAAAGIEDYVGSACHGFTLHSSTIVASGAVGVRSYCDDEIANSVIRQTLRQGDGVDVARGTLSISHSTIVGVSAGTVDPYYRPDGILANAGTRVDLGESIVAGFQTDLEAEAGYFDTYANVDVPTAIIAATRSSFASSTGDGVRVSEPTPDGDPRFIDATAGDYRLSDLSPLIDAGFEAQQGAAQTDRAGADRFADGNGDGKAESDIGAYEHRAAARRTPPTDSTGPTDPSRPADPEPQGNPAGEMRGQDTPVVRTPPRFAFAGTTLTVSRQRQVTLPVTCSSSAGGCNLAVVITAKVGGHSITLGRAGAARFKLTRRAVALLERSRIRRVTVALTATDAAGGQASATRSYRLRLR